MKIIRGDTAELIRPTSGYYDDNMDWVEVFPEGVCFECSIQPDLQGHTRVVEASGARSEDFLCIFTTRELKTSDEGKVVAGSQGQPADKVVIDGDNYVVFHVLKWRAARKLSHYNALLIREDAFGKINDFKSTS